MKTVVDFAQDGLFGPGIGDLLIRHGQEYSRDDDRLPKRWRQEQGEKKMCFRNSAELALSHPGEVTYVEGYAFPDIPLFGFPLAHAWLVRKDGLVVDPTWENGWGYFGIPIPAEQLSEYLLLNKEYGILQSLWQSPDLQDLLLSNLQG